MNFLLYLHMKITICCLHTLIIIISFFMISIMCIRFKITLIFSLYKCICNFYFEWVTDWGIIILK